MMQNDELIGLFVSYNLTGLSQPVISTLDVRGCKIFLKGGHQT
jgi:hypothetical protein